MKEEEIKRIALEKYPIDEFWVGDSATGRLYDENKRDRIVFERGLLESNDYHQQKTKELIEWVENEIKEHEKWDMEDHAYAYKQVLTKLKEELN